MSHFAVAVIHRDDQSVEELLAPYDENLEVEPYIEYTRDEAIAYAREHYLDKNASDEECYEYMADDYKVDTNGNLLSTYNPKSKWDWWEPGGRFSGTLKNKDGNRIDEGRIKDLVFDLDKSEYRYRLRYWDVVVNDSPLKPGETEDYFFNMFKKEYYIHRYGNAETYARIMASFSTYAVVTPDGEWHAPGDMGWFGMSDESDEAWVYWVDNYHDRFIEKSDPDWIMTIVDCHI